MTWNDQKMEKLGSLIRKWNLLDAVLKVEVQVQVDGSF